MTQKMFN